MFVTLMKGDAPVCDIWLGCLSLSEIQIFKHRIIDGTLLPDPLQEYMGHEKFPFLLGYWLEGRVKSNADPDLDRTMFEVYGLEQFHYGRMYYYQYIGAFMAYMMSDEDDYWTNPTHAQLLTYGLVDPHWVKGYLCGPAENLEDAREKGRAFRRCLRHPPAGQTPPG